MLIYEILKCEWNSSARAVVDTWTNYNVSLEDFRHAVLVKGLTHAESAITKMTVSRYSQMAGPCGLQLVEGQSKDGAIESFTTKAA